MIMELPNNLIQEQVVWQLLPIILSKKTSRKHALSDKECQQIKEVGQLWTKCCDPCCVISLAAVDVLVHLVVKNVLDFSYVMHGFVAQTLSTRHILGPIRGVIKLLCFQVKSTIEVDSYNLSSNLHPYTKILANCPWSWPMLLQEVENIFQTTNKRFISSFVAIFEAFFQHVFFNPKTDYSACKSLHVLLLEISSDMMEGKDIVVFDRILKLITNHLRFYKNNMESLGHSVSLCHQTLRWFLKYNCEKLDNHMKAMTVLFIEMVHKQLSLGMSMMSSLVLLRKITLRKPWIPLGNGTMFLISHLLLSCSGYYVEELIHAASNLAHYILSKGGDGTQKLSFLILPLLQILSSSRHRENETTVFTLASRLLKDIEDALQSTNFTNENKAESFPRGELMKKCSICENIYILCRNDESALLQWLRSVETSLSSSSQINKELSFISLLLSSFLLTCNSSITVHVLTTIVSVCKADPTQAPYFFPLMLFKMERCSTPEEKFHLLQTIPKLATHKVCVKQVLGILLVLNNNSELKAITLRLMFKLWMSQPRVFKHLHPMLQEKTLSLNPESWAELQLAKAVTIRDICRERPSQHAEDLVGMIDAIINENADKNSKVNIVLVCLALDSLETLVAAEVINLATIWEVFKAKLEHHSNPMVLRGLCDLFSLVPSSVVDSKQYENFKENVLLFLWRYSEHENEDISDASYKALSKFETKDFLIRHLPKQTRQTVTQRLLLTPKIKKMMEECLQNEKEMDIETLPIPAYFYVELLQRKVIFPGCYQGLEEFLKSIVAQEISNLPRGVEHSKMKAVQASENKSMSSIPEQLKKQYDKCKQPSLKSSIAVSLLYSYEIHAEKRSGKPIRSQVVNNIKLYRQLINQLVQDVPVNSSDWRSNIEISHAWTLFMNRVFDSYVQGRRAELELQNERGQIDEKAYNEGLKNASFWTRDALTDLLKAASKGSQIMHCNSLLALAALANAVFVRTSDDVTTNQELLANYKREGCISTEEWIACVADTLIVTLDRKLKTVGVPLSWGKQVSSTTLLAQAAAAIALAQITPCLIDAEFERFKQVLEVLQTRMSEQAKADSQTVVQTHCCIALGSIVQKLYDTNISDSLGQEGDILLATTFDALRKEALSSESNNTEGAIYGLGLAMSSLSYNTDVLVNDRAKSSYSKMVECFNNERVERDQDCKKLQELGIALACCTVSRFATDCLEVESVLKTFNMIKEVTETFPESVDLASAFGMLLCNLKGCGIIDNSEVVREWTAHWKAIASDKSLSLNSRIAAIFGLSFLFNQTQTSNSAGISPEDGVKILKQLLNIQGDYNLSGTVFKNLGKLYYASKNRLCNQPNVPDTLDYLGEDSVLNWLIQLMISLGKEVTKESEEVLNIILQVLTYGPKETLPPVDWNGIITPLIKMYTGKSTTLHFLELALCSTPSPATARFLPSWLTQSVYLSFSTDCQVRLFSCLPQLLNILSAKKLTNILDIAAKYFSNDEVDTRIAEAILDGLCSVMHMPEPPKSLCIKETIEKIYDYFPVDLKMLVPKLVACVQCLESHEIESLTAPTEESFAKSIMFRRRIILENPSMLKKLFKPCIDFTLSSMDVKYDAMMSLVSTISCVELRSDSRLSTEWILQFLTELSSTKSETKTVLLLLTTFTLATSGYDNGIFQIILALQQDNLFDHQAWFALIKNLFPYSFAFLLAQPQWKGRLEETIQKLLATCKDLDIKESSLLLDFLLEMRNFDVYEKHSVWSQVVCCM